VGDAAPALAVSKWVKGDPVDLAKTKGKQVVLIEFWATWCGPCIQSIPHLTELQHKYKDKLTVIGMSDEGPATVTRFARQWGDRMGYTIACDDKLKTNRAYMMASGQQGIPTAFIVDKEGRVAWIGSPFGALDRVLEEVIAGTYDVEKAVAEAKADAEFARTRQITLLRSLQIADWGAVIDIGKELVSSRKPLSRNLRIRVLDEVSWVLLTDERADKKYFKEAMDLARTAHDLTSGQDVSVLETYALALHENGKNEEAVAKARRALELAKEPMMRMRIQQNLRRYIKDQ
jgi:thiol-disulfide isomerase/thioredoxin